MRFDLSTALGRKNAEHDLMWKDHGFLRLRFQNKHWISEQLVRTNQPSPVQIKAWADAGIRTMVNLRGGLQSGFHALEVEACEHYGITLENFTVRSRDTHSAEEIFAAKDLFARIQYPALIHCKSGADRAGFMAALYMYFVQGQPIEQAMQQLSFKYLHIKAGKTGMLDFFFQTYLDFAAVTPISFTDWLETEYDRAEVKAAFMHSWWGNWLVDRALRRE
ncbi:Protein tyrosine phosphatase [hydrothermal vent metagenome]|uniref:Protein tyrosine phosphatase n=1 Tax=hydrothermal vent metagenome TaxID=652676 RepID=A0A3B0RDF6_9ZZZZ